MPITVPCAIISAMCARELSLIVLILMLDHIIAFLMGPGFLSSMHLSLARIAARPPIFS